VEQLVQTIALGLLVGGVLALAASGLTLIFGVMEVINVAHGALLILAAFLTWAVWTASGLDPLLIAVLTTPVMFAFGLALYYATLDRVRGAPPSTTVILTFAIAILLEGLMGFVWGNTSHSVTPGYFTQSFNIGGIFLPKTQVYGALIAAGLLTLLFLFLTRTWVGRAIRAASVNPSAAQLVGINIGTVAALTFAIGVATTGAGGSIIATLFPFLPGSHVAWISRLLGVVVLGGMGSLPGAVIGALLLGVAETMTSVYISVQWATAVPFLVIFAVLLLRPQGIMGVRLREDVV
jgi:branched-chain amino acid transport system permease protein